MHVPSVHIRKDVDADIEEFLRFLYRNTPEKRALVIRTYPELAKAVELPEEQGSAQVTGFVRRYYREHAEAVDVLVADMEARLASDAARVLAALGTEMDYAWPSDASGYIVIPTILPFSPLREPVFYFSLERFLRVRATTVTGEYSILSTLAHEVSHFIFFAFLRTLPADVQALYTNDLVYLAKEILAPVVMNRPRLEQVLHLTDYGGNYLLHHLVVSRDGKAENIVRFFENEYEQARESGASFEDFLANYMKTLASIKEPLHERATLWNEHGASLLKDETLRARYCEPIVLP